MRAAFLVTSYWAYGELLIAMEFAGNLKKSGHEILFIIPPTHKENVLKSKFACVTLIPKSQKFNRIILSEVQDKFKPDILILSDFLNYSFAHKYYGLIREDLDLITCKLATFDNYNWLLKRKYMDTYGYISSIPEKTDIRDYGERILPCPLVDPRDLGKDKGYRYGLINEFLDTSDANKNKLRQKYGFSKKERLLLVSYAKWQESHISHEVIGKFIDFSARLFDELIIRLSEFYTILCVGKDKSVFEAYQNIYCFDSMPSKVFNEYAVMSDLYIGKNMTSTSMVKLALSGITCVNIINSIVSPDKISEKSFGTLQYEEELSKLYLYKYMMLPVGWFYFLKPLFENNLYGDVIVMREQFKMQETLYMIHDLLHDREKKDEINKKVSLLKTELNKLNTPSQIIQSIIEK